MSPDPDPDSARAQVGAVVALKDLERAKSRIGPDRYFRRRLAVAMLTDTVRSLTTVLGTVVVVGAAADSVLTAEPGVIVMQDPGPDLNAALIAGTARLIALGYGSVLASVADIPTVRPSSIAEFTKALPQERRLFLSDTNGSGSTMLLARELTVSADLRPGFEGASAARHRSSGAVDPDPGRWPDARLDIDTMADLARARDLGLGRATRQLINGEQS